MADENPPPTPAAGSENERPADQPHAPHVESPAESATKSMLREAIQKVRDEIAYHLNEANKHMQQVEALRKDLRECSAFFRSGGNEASDKAGPESPAVGAELSKEAAAPRPRRHAAKRKHRSRRAKEA
jgi:hypothetical protein